MSEARKMKVLIVDDLLANQRLLEAIFKMHTDYITYSASSGREALDLLQKGKIEIPDIMLLDIKMPEMDGFELTKILKADPKFKGIPVIFITAFDILDYKVQAFALGGEDYIIKPFNTQEVLSRVRTHLRLKLLVDNLESEVARRTEELENLNLVLVSALEGANSYKDDDTGMHIKRVSHFSQIIAESLGVDKETTSTIYRYASLHDVGKVGVPDEILKKPGPLTDEEWIIMKKHCEIGFDLLNYPEFSDIAKNIVLFHHERWDGSGYPQGLKAEKIPLEARIVAIADVYDALRSERPYKKPFPEEKATQIIMESSGSHFDPEVVNAFQKNHEMIAGMFTELVET